VGASLKEADTSASEDEDEEKKEEEEESGDKGDKASDGEWEVDDDAAPASWYFLKVLSMTLRRSSAWLGTDDNRPCRAASGDDEADEEQPEENEEEPPAKILHIATSTGRARDFSVVCVYRYQIEHRFESLDELPAKVDLRDEPWEENR
jgi:hypothetical protein